MKAYVDVTISACISIEIRAGGAEPVNAIVERARASAVSHMRDALGKAIMRSAEATYDPGFIPIGSSVPAALATKVLIETGEI